MILISLRAWLSSGHPPKRSEGKLGSNPGSGDHLTITAPNDSSILAYVSLKIVAANEGTITASGDSRDEFRPKSRRDRRDSPDQPHLDQETGLVCRAGRRRLEERTGPPGLGNTLW